VIVHEEHPLKQKYLAYLKMGKGPLYVFYTPFHLPHIQLASTVARAVLSQDATIAPLRGPVCEVATVAKKPLKRGDVLDGVGGFASYGVIENSPVFNAEDLLPMGLSEGCRLTRDVAKDEPIRRADVEFPAGRLCDRLHAEQKDYFSSHAGRRR
jgi:predicted homoserine dehydrogenase-like protein